MAQPYLTGYFIKDSDGNNIKELKLGSFLKQILVTIETDASDGSFVLMGKVSGTTNYRPLSIINIITGDEASTMTGGLVYYAEISGYSEMTVVQNAQPSDDYAVKYDIYDTDKVSLSAAVTVSGGGSGSGGSGTTAWGGITGLLSDQADLSIELGRKVDTVAGKGLSENDFTNTLKTKLDGLTPFDPSTLDPRFNAKVDIEVGKGLSANDFTNVLKSKLEDDKKIVSLTQAQYDALATKDTDTVYYITDAPSSSGNSGAAVWGSITGLLTDQTDLKNTLASLVESVTYDNTSGVLTITKEDASTTTINLPLESFVQSGRYDNVNEELVLTLTSGTEIKIPVDDLITEYTAGMGIVITNSNIAMDPSVISIIANKVDNVPGKVLSSNDFTNDLKDKIEDDKLVVSLTQAQYNALATKDPDTVYYITDSAPTISPFVVLIQVQYDAIAVKDPNTFYYIEEV